MNPATLKAMLKADDPAAWAAAADLAEDLCTARGPSPRDWCPNCEAMRNHCPAHAKWLRFLAAWFEPLLYAFAYRDSELTVPLDDEYLARAEPGNVRFKPGLVVRFEPRARVSSVYLISREGGKKYRDRWLHYPRRGKKYTAVKVRSLAGVLYVADAEARPESGEFKWGA